MANDLNLCVFTGRLGRDVDDLRYTSGGTAVTTIRIAVGGRRKNGEQWEDTTEWVPVVLWGKRAELARDYLQKGARVQITGKFRTRTWDKDGETRYTTEIVASDMGFLGSRDSGAQNGNQAPQRNNQANQSGKQSRQNPPSNAAVNNSGFDDFDDDILF